MNKKNKFYGFLYDFFGGIIILMVILLTLFCCSDSFNEVSKNAYHKFFTVENDTLKINKEPVIIKSVPKDTVIITKKPTITKVNETIKGDTIKLSKGEDSLYYLQVTINGIPMKFALDTGCSGMSLSIIEYLFMERQGLIKDKSNQDCTTILANGEEEKCFSTTLDSIKIGNKKLTNVECTVSPNQKAALLLGQNILSKIGDTTIKYNKGIIIIE